MNARQIAIRLEPNAKNGFAHLDSATGPLDRQVHRAQKLRRRSWLLLD
jgi:hypothetical protein